MSKIVGSSIVMFLVILLLSGKYSSAQNELPSADQVSVAQMFILNLDCYPSLGRRSVASHSGLFPKVSAIKSFIHFRR